MSEHTPAPVPDDVEGLAETLALLWREHAACTWLSDGHNVQWSCGAIHSGPIQPTTRDEHLAALVASDWLAVHDARVRAEHGEKIAQAVIDQREGYLVSEGLDPSWVAGWHAAIDQVAARIAREAGK